MDELSDKIKKKLDNPKIIKGMAEHILVNCGKLETQLYYEKQKMGGHEDNIRYFFLDFPNKNLLISGEIYLSKKLTELFSPFKKEKLGNRQVLENFLCELNSCEKKFSSLNIFHFKNPFIINFNDPKKYNSGEIFQLFEKSSKEVFSFSEEKVKKFEKGEWQEYFAQVYISTWGAKEYFDFEEGRSEFLL